jgi:RNA polymerase sigma-70 factor (ECF subfamily)
MANKVDETHDAVAFRRELILAMPRLNRFARMLCRPPLEPDDLMQATCERALSRREQFVAGTRLDSWLFAIMHSLWKNNLRRLGVERTARASMADAPDSVDGERIAMGKIAVADVLTCLNALPPDQAAAITLVNLDGLSYAAAAAVLDIPIGTLESRIARGRIALGRLLAGEASAAAQTRAAKR